MFKEEVRRAIEAAPRSGLPELAQVMWKAFSAGHLSEAEAEELEEQIRLRTAVPLITKPAPRRTGSRPRSDASMQRRRRWAAAGRLPPQIACQFTVAEQAVLAVVTAEAVKSGDCRLAIDHIAAVAGVSRSTVKAALRQARTLGLLTVEERRQSAWRNLPNVVKIVSREWLAWMQLARRPAAYGGGVKSSTSTNTDRKEGAVSGPVRRCRGLPKARDVGSARANDEADPLRAAGPTHA